MLDCPHILVLIIPPAGQVHLRHVMPDLPALQGLVGGYIQSLLLPYRGLLYFNEEGKHEGLPANPHATLLARHLNVGLAPNDVIAGTAIALGATTRAGVSDGNEHDVPEQIISACRDLGLQVDENLDPHVCPASTS